jgi:hypothetical protein
MGGEIRLTSGDAFHFIQLIANHHALLCLPWEILGSLNPQSHVLIQRLLCPGVFKLDEPLPPSLYPFSRFKLQHDISSSAGLKPRLSCLVANVFSWNASH